MAFCGRQLVLGQPGDLVTVPLVEERTPLLVVVSGAVNQAGDYEVTVDRDGLPPGVELIRRP